MAELVDALDSKSGYRKVVQVRFLFWAQKQQFICCFFCYKSFFLSPLHLSTPNSVIQSRLL